MPDDLIKEKSDGNSSDFFRRNWAIYRKITENNYMSHVEAYGKLRQILTDVMKRPFGFLDLACGDAYHSSRCLVGTRVAEYTGIDLSKAALSTAADELHRLDCGKVLEIGDMKEFESVLGAPHDVVWVGLSLHHFETVEKAGFMERVHDALTDDGIFLIYEPVFLDGEDRASYFHRIKAIVENGWTGLTEEDMDLVLEHVRTTELPETPGDWIRLGKDVGFGTAEKVFSEKYGLYCLFMYRK